MTVADLIRELQSMPPNAEIRISTLRIVHYEEAPPLAYEVKYEGQFVGIYA